MLNQVRYVDIGSYFLIKWKSPMALILFAVHCSVHKGITQVFMAQSTLGKQN